MQMQFYPLATHKVATFMPENSYIKIIIADDHKVVSGGLSRVLKDEGYQIISTAENGEELLELLSKESNINLVLLDIDMPKIDGKEAAKNIKYLYPHIKILAISSHIERRHIEDMLASGAVGFFHKSGDEKELAEAVRIIISGHTYIPTKIHQILYSQTMGYTQIPLFSEREIAVLKLLADGRTSDEIAMALELSTSTVNTHRNSMLSKSGTKNVAQLIRFATLNGLI